MTPTAADVHWSRRLADVQDQFFVAHDLDEIARACLTLTSLLADGWGQTDAAQAERIVQLERLVRDAARMFKAPAAVNSSDIRDWQRAAAPYLGSEK